MEQLVQETGAEFEQLSREIGRRWGMRMKAHYLSLGKSLGTWPGTLEEARGLVDATLGPVPGDDERELLALLVERGARRAWQSS